MSDPDWYRDWRHDAVHELQAKIERLKAEFRLGTWPRFDYDLDAGTLVFSEDGAPRVIQVLGSTSAKAGNWLWAWANGHWPASRTVDAGRVRAFGETHGIHQLVDEYVVDEDLNALGWALTAVAARVTGGIGAYRPSRDEGGALFLLYRSMTWAS